MSETRLHLSGRAATGRDIYRGIREQINNLRNRGVEPKKVWVSPYIADCIHALWFAVAQKYDMRIPPGVSKVPMGIGSGLGRANFVFEYHEDKEKGHTLRRNPVSNPLPDND